MPLDPGRRLGPYEIVAPLGAGGMGEVYRARDTRLKRDVAIKVLPADVAGDHERLARFQREAEVLASLNHPHIAQVYGIEENALVMELVEGEDLSQRIGRGPIPVEEALPMARQIAEALEAAHDHGIVHRDLKPANVKLRPDGTVKVLDFGLAKAIGEQGSGSRDQGSGELANSPTITSPAMTMHGMILGTAAYMSPEQAKGKAVDRRADIWAFGCVLYEMLTAQRTFAGEDVSDTLVSILRDDPRWTALPADTPAGVRLLIRRCLQRDPQKRLPHIGVARLELMGDPGLEAQAVASTAPRRPAAALAIATLIGALALGVPAYFLGARAGTETPPPPSRFDIKPPPGMLFPGAANIPRLSVSPDGRLIAYQLTNQKGASLWLRPIDSIEAQSLGPTDGDQNGLSSQQPFWSSDSRYLAFFDESASQLKRLDRLGGTVQTIADIDGTQMSGTWNANDVILYSTILSNGIWRVAGAGGNPVQVTSVNEGTKELHHLWPDFLPDGKRFIYLALHANRPSAVHVGTLDGSDSRQWFESASMARIVPPDRVMFVRNRSLVSRQFDPDTLELIGEPQVVAENVGMTPTGRVGVSASRNGVLVYATDGFDDDPFEASWLDRAGRPIAGSTSFPVGLNGVRLSPDGTRALYSRRTLEGGTVGAELWMRDLTRGIDSRINVNVGGGLTPVVSPAGDRIIFQRVGGASGIAASLHLQPISGAAAEKLLLASGPDLRVTPQDWSSDGRTVLAIAGAPGSALRGLYTLDVDGDQELKPYLVPLEARTGAAFSPDGKWVAYSEGEPGQVFLRPYPNGAGGKWPLSAAGARHPMWRRDGKEIYYLDNTRQQVMAVPIAFSPEPEIGAPVPLFQFGSGQPDDSLAAARPLDVSPDGQRFIIVRSSPQRVTTRLVVTVGQLVK